MAKLAAITAVATNVYIYNIDNSSIQPVKPCYIAHNINLSFIVHNIQYHKLA